MVIQFALIYLLLGAAYATGFLWGMLKYCLLLEWVGIVVVLELTWPYWLALDLIAFAKRRFSREPFL